MHKKCYLSVTLGLLLIYGYSGQNTDPVLFCSLTLNTSLSPSVLSTHLQANVPAEHNPVDQGVSFQKCICKFCLHNL